MQSHSLSNLQAHNSYLALGLFIVLLWADIPVWAQGSYMPTPLPKPSEEKFDPSDGLISTEASERGYRTMSEQNTVCIYNADGSLWYEFSEFPDHPLFYEKHPKPEFSPYELKSTFWTTLRLMAISKNWHY